jgi:hypothetical protein
MALPLLPILAVGALLLVGTSGKKKREDAELLDEELIVDDDEERLQAPSQTAALDLSKINKKFQTMRRSALKKSAIKTDRPSGGRPSGDGVRYRLSPPLVKNTIEKSSLEGVLREALPQIAYDKVKSMTGKFPKIVRDPVRKKVKELTRKAIDKALERGDIRKVDSAISDVFREKFIGDKLGVPRLARPAFNRVRGQIINAVVSKINNSVRGVEIIT